MPLYSLYLILNLNKFDPSIKAHDPDQINKPGFNDQRPIHMACYRGDDRLVKVGVSYFISIFIPNLKIKVINRCWC